MASRRISLVVTSPHTASIARTLFVRLMPWLSDTRSGLSGVGESAAVRCHESVTSRYESAWTGSDGHARKALRVNKYRVQYGSGESASRDLKSAQCRFESDWGHQSPYGSRFLDQGSGFRVQAPVYRLPADRQHLVSIEGCSDASQVCVPSRRVQFAHRAVPIDCAHSAATDPVARVDTGGRAGCPYSASIASNIAKLFARSLRRPPPAVG